VIREFDFNWGGPNEPDYELRRAFASRPALAREKVRWRRERRDLGTCSQNLDVFMFDSLAPSLILEVGKPLRSLLSSRFAPVNQDALNLDISGTKMLELCGVRK